MRKRQYFGRILRTELFISSLILLGGIGLIFEGEVGAGVIVTLATSCLLIAFMAFPGPLKATASSVGVAVVAVTLLVLWYFLLWKPWLGGGLVGPFLAGFTAGVVSELLGRLNDRILGSRVIASEVQERMANGHLVNIPGLFLHCHHGKWFGMAESTLPIPLHLKDGTSKLLLPGDRHFWLAKSDGRAPDIGEMMVPREIYAITECSD